LRPRQIFLRALIVLWPVEMVVPSLQGSSISIARASPIHRLVLASKAYKPCCDHGPPNDLESVRSLDCQHVLFDWQGDDFKMRRLVPGM
jgi:hypothetical protein